MARKRCRGRLRVVKCDDLLMWENVVLALVFSWFMVIFSTCLACCSGRMAMMCWLKCACSSYRKAFDFFLAVVL